MRPTLLLLIAAGLAGFTTGCMSVGPASVRANRPAYNLAIQQSSDQELLLNLVRIHYRDTLYFTTVERIAATQELLESASASVGISQLENNFSVPPTSATIVRAATRPLTLGPATVAVNEKPTIFYAPIEGEKFVRQMMTPMNADLLLMLVQSGWSLDRVFLLGVSQMNGVKNAPTASGLTPSRAPDFELFQRAVRHLRVLQREGLLDVVRGAGPQGGMEIVIAPAAADRPETTELRTWLHLSPERLRFKIVPGADAPGGEQIAITTRPVLSAINYLSQGIDFPADDIKAGRLRQTTTADGRPFDWQDMMRDLFHVVAAERAPATDEASTAIHYRGHWFYIADNDLETKSTFVLLTQLIALHSPPVGNPASVSIAK